MKIQNTQAAGIILKELGRRLEFERIQRGVQQTELATAAGLSRRTIVRMGHGTPCRLDAFVAVLKQFGIADRLNVVLPEPSLTPIQEARLAAAGMSVPKRVRKCRVVKVVKSDIRHWGDGVPVVGKDDRGSRKRNTP